MEMLEGLPKLTLEFLNEATQAWIEIEYNRAVHREIRSRRSSGSPTLPTCSLSPCQRCLA